MSIPIPAFGAVLGPIIGAIIKGVNAINDAEHAKQEKFTQTTVEALRLRYPAYNVLIVHPKHSRNLVNEHHDHKELPITPPRTVGYEIYVFESGTFTLEGDGGFINWCFSGRYTREGANRVHFSKVPSQIPPIPSPPEPTPPPPAANPVRLHPDGIYLVNCRRGQEISSGVAYYRNLRNGGNFGQIPDDYVDVTKGSFTNWEQTGTVTFGNGTRFRWSIINDAQAKANFTRVGVADNTFVAFNLYKDTQAVLYEVDGWKCQAIYWGF
ncbi:hypothetical protein ONS95_002083 [Cadophora gregata]|uniref:uncharacterized protein n=1 Tax=Cadophora gregata TaxID=51156 RepID=UPI0026DBA786|nr:uncharacterized protein ONS95_002083 [Cadophora gregata]KAK0111746.1 hypothetical protein ONS95_002083 [Cadophora gregata]KAK0111781.1 hypothetical protein ONS96_001050 [Cadophora gregata f. sp. sojae]